MDKQPLTPQTWWQANFGHPAAFSRPFDRLFDDFLRDFGAVAKPDAALVPRADISETADAYELAFDMPGVEDKDIDVSVANGVLTLKGEKRSETRETDEKKNLIRSERSYGSFHRSLALPADIDETKIDAKTENGVLRITVPKARDGKSASRKIEIRKA